MDTNSRSTSFAYASVSPASTFMSKVNYAIRTNLKAIMATSTFVLFVLFMSSDTVHNEASSAHSIQAGNWGLRGSHIISYFGGAYYPGYFNAADAVNGKIFKFAAVTDLDQLSRAAGNKLAFQSMLVPGILKQNDQNKYEIFFEEPRMLTSQHNEGGRGMELSELTLYQNRLLAFDDRTGTVFEILNENQGTSSIIVPRLVITEGNGETDKGMKWEWASVKGKELYLGSMGKEYTRPDGSIANTNNLWIAMVDADGRVRRKDWSREYTFVRDVLGASAPGYVIHEAVLWSQHLKKWIFVPRRISNAKYDDNEDEKKGSNKLVLVDENFSKAEVIDIKFAVVDPLHGFSTISFIPGTKDRHVLAVRSVEEDCVGGDESLCKQRSYFTVFNVITGEVLMEETEIHMKHDMKFEGVEFVNINTIEPPRN